MSAPTPVEAVRFTAADAVPTNGVVEVELPGEVRAVDPWAAVEVDVSFVAPDGSTRSVPAFVRGDGRWCVRYTSAIEGAHRYRANVRVVGDVEAVDGLEGAEGEVTFVAYDGDNSLLRHGPLTVAPSRRTLCHADGTPFLWLADTWWFAMTARFRWPATFQALADDRVAKGFNVVQVVAGLIPEVEPFSAPMASEGGQPLGDGGAGPVNPAFYDVPDVKIDDLVGRGIVPCIVGGWGNYGPLLGPERLRQHWRHLVARYAAHPVVWCIAGEVDTAGMDFGAVDPRSPAPVPVRPEAVALWEDVARYVGEIDPFDRVRTVHPCPFANFASSESFTDRSTFELDMLQTGHTGLNCVTPSMEHLRRSLAHGDKPVLNGESCYEGIFGSNWHDVQRFFFWSHLLSGAAGHTYGTMGIACLNGRDDPLPPKSGVSDERWEDAIDYLGSRHVGIGKAVLEQIGWPDLTPSPSAIEPHAGPEDWCYPYAAVRSDGAIVAYLPSTGMNAPMGAERLEWGRLNLQLALGGLAVGTTYRLVWINPRTGDELDGGVLHAESAEADLPRPFGHRIIPTGEDWVLVATPDSAAGDTT